MPAPARLRAPAKLTRTLEVVGRRPDGYHLLEAEMVSVDLADEIEIVPEAAAGGGEAGAGAGAAGIEVIDAVDWSGPPAEAGGPLVVPTGADNLVARALHLAGRRARVRLVKRIPSGAGLGGGSSDAAAVLAWAGFTDLAAAARLGADVPFCLVGGRAKVTGIGERLEVLPPLDETFVVASPAFGVPTAAVYAAYDELAAQRRPDAPHTERGVANDLEPAACAVEPRLARVRAVLAEAAGRAPLLAGSGASWFFACGADGPGAKALLDEVGEALTAAGVRAAVHLCKAVGPRAR